MFRICVNQFFWITLIFQKVKLNCNDNQKTQEYEVDPFMAQIMTLKVQ